MSYTERYTTTYHRDSLKTEARGQLLGFHDIVFSGIKMPWRC